MLVVDGAGRLQVEALRERLHSHALPRPALVHCQWGNHEVGTLQPVHRIVALCREAGITVHVDAAAACGHVPTDLAALDADLVSISAHKLGGVPVPVPWSYGAGAGSNPSLWEGTGAWRRAGARGVPALLAFGAAAAALTGGGASALTTEAATARQRITTLVGAALVVEGVTVVGPSGEARLPHLVCLGVHGVEAEPVLIGLRPCRHRRPFGLRLLVREHRAVAGARGDGRRLEPFLAAQRRVDDDRRGLQDVRPGNSPRGR